MAIDLVINDVGEIYSRLFDHHPVLQGEINYIVKEHEEKRGDREIERIKITNQHAEEINKEIFPQVYERLMTTVPDFLEKAKKCADACNRVADKEEEWKKSDPLANKRSERLLEWSEFMKEQCKKSAEVDENFEQKFKENEQFYRDLEEKLRLPVERSDSK